MKAAEKRRSSIVFGLTLIVFAGLALTDFTTPTGRLATNLDGALADLDTAKTQYNDNIGSVPGFVTTILGDEVVHATITRADGSVVELSAVSEDGRIERIEVVESGPTEEHTLIITTTEATIDSIFEADDQVEALRAALDNEDIKIETNSFFTATKVFFGKLALTVTGWFR